MAASLKRIDSQSDATYLVHRLLLHCFDQKELVGQLPLPLNADFCRSISFSKGCYLGQEVTARAHFTGLVRKRACLFVVTSAPVREFAGSERSSSNIEALLPYVDMAEKRDLRGLRVKDARGQRALHVITNYGNLAVCFFHFMDCAENQFQQDGLYFYRVRQPAFEHFLDRQRPRAA